MMMMMMMWWWWWCWWCTDTVDVSHSHSISDIQSLSLDSESAASTPTVGRVSHLACIAIFSCLCFWLSVPVLVIAREDSSPKWPFMCQVGVNLYSLTASHLWSSINQHLSISSTVKFEFCRYLCRWLLGDCYYWVMIFLWCWIWILLPCYLSELISYW